jgi:truncated hemoglobin YjbI
MSLWDDAGGEEGVRKILQRLYDRLFADMMVGFLFQGKDKAKIVEHQVWFTARFLGGPQDRYTGRPMPEAHAELPLLAGHFDRRHHLLRETLEELAVPEHVVKEWLRIDQQLRTAVLKSGADARERVRTEK